MNKTGLILCSIVVGLIIISGCNQRSPDNVLISFSYIEENFSNPPAEYRPAPFWIWHDVVTEQKIREQFADFKEKGIGGVFVHPRYGLVTEYLSDEWFELFAYTLEVGEELGTKIWIYDENSFPSGFAGGYVPAQMPESYNQGQGLVIHEQEKFLPKEGTRYLHYYKQDDSGEYVEISDIESEEGKSGRYVLVELINYPQSKWYAGYSYVDLIYPGVTEKFIGITMTGYEQFADHFGNLIPGVFTDEPNIAPPGGKNCIRWTPDLYERFHERWGYRLEENLLSLFFEKGDWEKVRHNYYQLLLQLFIDRWSKPWFEYTEKNNLIWTGHYWEHGWPSPHHGGDNMAMYAWHQMPGIDLLFNTMDQEDMPIHFGDPRLVKELKSVASQMGRKRTLSETYGASGWELTMEDQKRLGDWAYALGLNYLNPHLAFMTLQGDRKHDFPQSFSYHAPYWDFYRYKTDYFARLSMVLSNAEQYNDILIIEPTSTTWMYYSSYSPNNHLDSIGTSFQSFLDRLEANRIEYDLGSENIIKDHGFIKNGKFGINQREYDLVVLPQGIGNLDKPTFDLLKKYLKQGGVVVSLGHYPFYIDGAVSQELSAVIKQYSGNWFLANDFTDENVENYFYGNEIEFSTADHKIRKLFHYRGRLSDGQVVFLANTNMNEHAGGSFTIKGNTVALLDAVTGEIGGYPFERENGRMRVEFDLAPANSLLFFISDESRIFKKSENDKTHEMIAAEIPLAKVSPLSDNVLVLDYCKLKIHGKEQTPLVYFYTAGDMVWQHYGFDDNPWVSSSQFKTELVDRDTFDISTGYQLTFPFEVNDGVNLSSLKAVVERPGLFMVEVNGNSVNPIEGEWYLEKDFGVYDISAYVTTGQNKISYKVKPMSMFAEAAPVFIIGDFSVLPQVNGFRIEPSSRLEAGSWKEQGYPFYSRGVSYSKIVEIDEVPERVMVKLNRWQGTVAEVRVNGYHAAILAWQPFETEITPLLTTGVNEVEVVVYGSLKNILGPHHFVARRGIVTPWSFKYAPEVQPTGNEYDLLDYGLLEDFSVMVSMSMRITSLYKQTN